VKTRPLYARAARDNFASLRVLEKCGFWIVGYERGFACARGEEIEEVVLELTGDVPEAQATNIETDAAVVNPSSHLIGSAPDWFPISW
jgi:hypothetical protein